jgi:hypothetical protein
VEVQSLSVGLFDGLSQSLKLFFKHHDLLLQLCYSPPQLIFLQLVLLPGPLQQVSVLVLTGIIIALDLFILLKDGLLLFTPLPPLALQVHPYLLYLLLQLLTSKSVGGQLTLVPNVLLFHLLIGLF